MEQWLVVGISGVTCSGKTTLAQSLYSHLKEMRGHEIKPGIELNRVELINQDTYFRKEDDPNHQRIEKLNHLNWEILESIDMVKMVKEVMKTLGNDFKLYPTRSSFLANNKHHENIFLKHQTKQRLFRRPEKLNEDEDSSFCNFKKLVKQNHLLNILLIEGFLVLNDSILFDLCNVKYHLHVPYEVCFMRRSERIYDPPDVPCKFKYEKLWIYINSGLLLHRLLRDGCLAVVRKTLERVQRSNWWSNLSQRRHWAWQVFQVRHKLANRWAMSRELWINSLLFLSNIPTIFYRFLAIGK